MSSVSFTLDMKHELKQLLVLFMLHVPL